MASVNRNRGLNEGWVDQLAQAVGARTMGWEHVARIEIKNNELSRFQGRHLLSSRAHGENTRALGIKTSPEKGSKGVPRLGARREGLVRRVCLEAKSRFERGASDERSEPGLRGGSVSPQPNVLYSGAPERANGALNALQDGGAAANTHTSPPYPKAGDGLEHSSPQCRIARSRPRGYWIISTCKQDALDADIRQTTPKPNCGTSSTINGSGMFSVQSC